MNIRIANLQDLSFIHKLSQQRCWCKVNTKNRESF